MLDKEKINQKVIEKKGKTETQIASVRTLALLQEEIINSVLGRDNDLSMIEKMAATYIMMDLLKMIYGIPERRINEEVNFQMLLMNERFGNGGC